MEKGTIAVLVPAAAPIDQDVFASIVTAVAYACNHGRRVLYILPCPRMNTPHARNQLVKWFLETDAEYAFWFDQDMGLPKETIYLMAHRAEEFGLQFLSGIYYQRIAESGHKPLIYKQSPTSITGKKVNDSIHSEFELNHINPDPGAKMPFSIDACGFGCVLVHRDVFEKVERPWFKDHYYDPFDPTKYTSEDLYFCYKARNAGVKLFATPEIKCGHQGRAPFITEQDFVKAGGQGLVQIKVDYPELVEERK